MKEDPYEDMMSHERMYYHCCKCGGIYTDKNKTQLITILKTPSPLPKILEGFCVSSGLCSPCYDSVSKRNKNCGKKEWEY